MPTEKPCFTITLDKELLKRLEDYRFENRLPNRTQATLELIHRSLDEYDKSGVYMENNRVVQNIAVI